MSVFSEGCHPLSSADILERLQHNKVAIDRATVYRQVSRLKELLKLRVVDLGDGVTRYELNEDHHHHLVCLRCKKIVAIDLSKKTEGLLQQIEQTYKSEQNFILLTHNLAFFGICSDCQYL